MNAVMYRSVHLDSDLASSFELSQVLGAGVNLDVLGERGRSQSSSERDGEFYGDG